MARARPARSGADRIFLNVISVAETQQARRRPALTKA
jgi:hypothetical protein